MPDCGAMCQMIEHAVKKKPYFIGKPEPGMVDMSVAQNHFTKDETLVIGDRLYTDILSGINAGVETALVLTGEATRKDAEESSYKPDYIFRQCANFTRRGSDHRDRDTNLTTVPVPNVVQLFQLNGEEQQTHNKHF